MMVPVIAGLVVGIGLIVLLSMSIKPSFTMTEDEIRAKVRSLPEVQALYSRYTPLEGIVSDGTMTYAYYQIGRSFNFGEHHKSLQLTVTIDPFGKTDLDVQCVGPVTVEDEPTVEYILTTPCIEQP